MTFLTTSSAMEPCSRKTARKQMWMWTSFKCSQKSEGWTKCVFGDEQGTQTWLTRFCLRGTWCQECISTHPGAALTLYLMERSWSYTPGTKTLYFCRLVTSVISRRLWGVGVQIVSEYCHLIVLSLFFECLTMSSRSQNKCFFCCQPKTTNILS